MLLALMLTAWLGAQAATVESVVVHGNHTTPTDEVLALAGEVVGQEASDALLVEVTRRLEQSRRFAGVDVRRRYLSIDDPTRVLIVIVVREVPGVSDDDLTPGPLRRLAASGMWAPVVEYQEGYGFTYGARLASVDLFGPRTRIAVPLTWGGERQATVEVERSFAAGPVARVAGGGGITRRVNPAFDVADTRRLLWGRVESAPRTWLRAGVGARRAAVAFGALDDRLTTLRADVTVDTRVDPALPRNAVYVLAGVERLGFDGASLGLAAADSGRRSALRRTVDARGYVGLLGQTVLGLRGQLSTASAPLPDYERAILGGAASLRGFDVGIRSGDNLAATSAELVLPVSSPLSVARAGLKLFVDAGTTYAAGERLGRQRLDVGYGAGVFLTATVFHLAMDVGWGRPRGGGGADAPRRTVGPNLHVQLGVRLGT